MTLTIKQLRCILDEYPDDYTICGLCVQVYNGSECIKQLHELQIPYHEDDI